MWIHIGYPLPNSVLLIFFSFRRVFYPENPGIDGWVESIMRALKESESFVPSGPNYSQACKYEKWRDEIDEGSVVISDPVPEEVTRIYYYHYYLVFVMITVMQYEPSITTIWQFAR